MLKLIQMTCLLLIVSCSDKHNLDKKLVKDVDGRVFRVQYNIGVTYFLNEEDPSQIEKEAEFITKDEKKH